MSNTHMVFRNVLKMECNNHHQLFKISHKELCIGYDDFTECCGYKCDVCGVEELNNFSFRCEICDYDMCLQCANERLK